MRGPAQELIEETHRTRRVSQRRQPRVMESRNEKAGRDGRF